VASHFVYLQDDIAAFSPVSTQLRELSTEVEGGGESDGEAERDGMLMELKEQRTLLQKEHDKIHQLELYNDRLNELVADAKLAESTAVDSLENSSKS
jgi:hypothetical protein